MWWVFRAEWRKIAGNRWLTGCLVWIWVAAAGLLSAVLAIAALVDSGTAQRFVDEPSHWTDASLFFWAIPNSIIGRLLIIGFTAGIFGGEYQWGTWKHILPRRGRITLIMIKFFTVAVFILIAFGITSIVWVVGLGLVQLAAGGAYPPALDNIPPRYWTELGIQILTAFLSILIVSALAAFIALLTRSMLASVVAGLFAAIIDGFFAAAVIILFLLTDARIFPSMFRFTVSYNVDNLINWAETGNTSNVLGSIEGAENPIIQDLVVDPPIAGNSVELSLFILGVWLMTFVGLSVWSFYRQDLTS